jgi:hypothetical protein
MLAKGIHSNFTLDVITRAQKILHVDWASYPLWTLGYLEALASKWHVSRWITLIASLHIIALCPSA